MEENLFFSLENTGNTSTQKEEENKKKEKTFYDKVLAERNKSEMITENLETITTSKLKISADKIKIARENTKIIQPIKKELKQYTHEEALASSVEYFGGDTLAANVWINKYALKDSYGNIFEKNPDEMHHRIANEISRVENRYSNPMSHDEIYSVLKNFKYIIPSGSPMAGIGNDFQISSLSNCFVIGNEGDSDSYGGIMKIDQEQVQLMKRRGGVGHDLTHIRPGGSPVKNTALSSTGVVPFMERYSNSTREVAQDGRRGALMLSISIKHPDAERFIDAKMESGKVTGANVSVKLDDEFMHAVKNGTTYTQQYPINSSNPTVKKEIDARELWGKIVHNAWSSAEPGILFWDTIIRESIPDHYQEYGFKTVSTNPCGEIPLCPYDSCRLLALNLYSYVEKPFTEEAYFNGDLFTKHARIAHRIMDDIVDLEVEKVESIIAKIDSDPESEEIKAVERNLWKNIREKSLQGRRTGIGITAEGDMLAALGLRYGSDSAITFSTEVHKLLAIEVYRASVDLAEERGAFPIFDYKKEVDNPFINRIKENAPHVYEKMVKVGRRNISMLTIAPTGSISICTQTSSGIEPVFMVSYKRRRKVNPNDKNVDISFVDEIGDSWEEYNVFHPKFEIWLDINGYDVADVKSKSDTELDEIIAKSPYFKATSNEINWVSKVKMQGDIQKWIDHSISVTVNVSNDIEEKLVSDIYFSAWESGCKGMTIYRDGSRSGVLISNTKKEETNENDIIETRAPKRPKTLEASIIRFQNNYEKWIAVIGQINGKPYEIFTGKSEDFFIPPYVEGGIVERVKQKDKRAQYNFTYKDKQGYEITMPALSRMFDDSFWNYAKLISGVLRHGMPLQYVIDLIGNLNFPEDNINTWKNGVVRALKRFVPDGTTTDTKCPDCGEETLIYEDGCLICKSCGHSKCG